MRYSASTHIPRPKFVMNNSNWVYLYLPLMLVVSKWNCFEARTAAQGYDIAPGHTYVLNNVTITLPWASSIQENYIIFCNWQHLFPGATGWDRFVGYDNVKKTRLEHSYRHVGWEFTNTDHPCLGGLSRQNVQPDYEGIYQMVIMDQDQQRFEANGHVTVVRDKEVQYKIMIDEDVYNLTLHDAVPALPDLAANVGEHVNVQVELEDNFPPSNITVSQHGRPVIRCLVVAICTGYVSYSESDKMESFEIRIDPDIQGAQSVTLKQTVSVTSVSSPSQSTVVVITIVVTLIILAIIIALCVLVGWRQGWMKCKREKPKSFIVETPSCIKGSHHSAPEQTPLKSEESQMIALVDVNTQFEPLYGKLQEDVEKLVKRENDTSNKYQRQIDSFGEFSNKLEAEEITLNKVLSDLSVTHMNADKLLSEHVEFIKRSDDEIQKTKFDRMMRNSMAGDKRVAVSSKKNVEILMNQCETSSSFLQEALLPDLRQIDTDIELYKNLTQCKQDTFSDICDNCRKTDPAVVSSQHEVLQPDSEDEKQLSKRKLKTQVSDYSNLYEASMRLREMLDELKDTPTNKHEQYDQVNNRIEEAQRKCSAQDMKLKNFNTKLAGLNNDFNKMCNDSHVS